MKEQDKQDKFFYEAPVVTVFEVRQEGIICSSQVNGTNSVDNWGNGGTTNDDTYM